jgi:hypothetical protein
MMNPLKSWRQMATVAVVLIVSMSQPVSAITADVAKKCRELAVKAHPPAVAGSKTGTAQAERDYFRACIAKGGNMPADDAKK